MELVGEYIPVSNVIHTMILTNSRYELAKLLSHDRSGAIRSIASYLADCPAVKQIGLLAVETERATYV